MTSVIVCIGNSISLNIFVAFNSDDFVGRGALLYNGLSLLAVGEFRSVGVFELVSGILRYSHGADIDCGPP